MNLHAGLNVIKRAKGTRQREGVTLLETIFVLIIATSAISAGSYFMSEHSKQQVARSTADHLIELTGAYNKYIQDNYADLTQQVSSYKKIDVNELKKTEYGENRDTSYLSPAFQNTNAYGQKYVLAIRKVGGKSLQGLIYSTDGEVIEPAQALRISQLVGASGGFTLKNEPAKVRANMDGYNVDLTDFGGGGEGGKLVSAIFMNEHAIVHEDYLYRNKIEGRPELNRMNVDLSMGLGTKAAPDASFDINDVRNINVLVNVDAGQNITAGGNVEAQGNVTAQGKVRAEGNVEAGQNLSVAGNANVQGTATIHQNLWVYGNTNIGGSAVVNQDLTVDNNLLVRGDTNITGDTVMNGDLRVKGEKLTVDGIIKVNKTVSLGTPCQPGDIARTAHSTVMCRHGVWASIDYAVARANGIHAGYGGWYSSPYGDGSYSMIYCESLGNAYYDVVMGGITYGYNSASDKANIHPHCISVKSAQYAERAGVVDTPNVIENHYHEHYYGSTP